jgi:F-type H+-transporting ATPase subunit delta
MKTSRDARKRAKKLYRYCIQNGQLDQVRLRSVVSYLASSKPRNYIAILERIKKLVEMEIDSRTIDIQTAEDLPDQGAALFAEVERRFGPALRKAYKVNPDLIGGLRIQRGSDVWDGSVKERLRLLAQNLN